MRKAGLIRYRRLVITNFAIEAGRLLGLINAHYEVLNSEGLPVDGLVRALENLRKICEVDVENLN